MAKKKKKDDKKFVKKILPNKITNISRDLADILVTITNTLNLLARGEAKKYVQDQLYYADLNIELLIQHWESLKKHLKENNYKIKRENFNLGAEDTIKDTLIDLKNIRDTII